MPVASNFAEVKLAAVFDALLADGPLLKRLDGAIERLNVLEFYKHELPDGVWDQLVLIIKDLEHKVAEGSISCICPLTPEQQAELAGRLLSLYIETNDGVLIF